MKTPSRHLRAWASSAALAPLLLLIGCTNAPEILIAEQPPALTAQHSKAAAAVAAARTANSENPQGLPRLATDNELNIASRALPQPSKADLEDARARIELTLAGKLEQAEDRYHQAELTLQSIREQAARERAEADAKLKKILEDKDRESAREAYLAVVKVFAVIGAALAIGGILIALWSTYKRAGILIAISGPLVGGSGLLWGKPWFYATVGIAVLLVGAAAGIRYVWSFIEKTKEAKP